MAEIGAGGAKPGRVPQEAEQAEPRSAVDFLHEDRKIFVRLSGSRTENATPGVAHSDKELASLFSVVGPVSRAHWVRQKGTDQSRGFGFVQFEDASCVATAISRFNGGTLMGQQCVVRAVEERVDTAKAAAARENHQKFREIKRKAEATRALPRAEKRKKKKRKLGPLQPKVSGIPPPPAFLGGLCGHASITRAQRDAGVVTGPIFIKQIAGDGTIGDKGDHRATLVCTVADLRFDPQVLLGDELEAKAGKRSNRSSRRKKVTVCFEIGQQDDGQPAARNVRLPTEAENTALAQFVAEHFTGAKEEQQGQGMEQRVGQEPPPPPPQQQQQQQMLSAPAPAPAPATARTALPALKVKAKETTAEARIKLLQLPAGSCFRELRSKLCEKFCCDTEQGLQLSYTDADGDDVDLDDDDSLSQSVHDAGGATTNAVGPVLLRVHVRYTNRSAQNHVAPVPMDIASPVSTPRQAQAAPTQQVQDSDDSDEDTSSDSSSDDSDDDSSDDSDGSNGEADSGSSNDTDGGKDQLVKAVANNSNPADNESDSGSASGSDSDSGSKSDSDSDSDSESESESESESDTDSNSDTDSSDSNGDRDSDKKAQDQAQVLTKKTATPVTSTSSSAFAFVATIEAFAAGTEQELHLPANLGRYERLLAHEKAGALGLEHKSVGDGPARHIVVRKM